MSEEKKTPEQELAELGGMLKTATDEVKQFAEKTQTELKNLGKNTEETKANADKALTEMNGIAARMTELEQKVARRAGGSDGSEEMKSLGQMVVDDAKTKEFLAGPKRGQVHIQIETKNITSATSTVGTGVSPATSMVVPQREPIVPIQLRRLTIRDLLTPGQTNSAAIEYPVENVFTNAAVPVAEAAAKPQSDLTFDLKSVPVRTVAHYMKASRQILDDAPMLTTYIDGRLRYGLQLVEEAQLLFGDGTGQNILGLVPQASAYSAAFTVTGETAIDRLRLASLQATLALYSSTGYVLHPTDWAKIEVTKDGMGRYLVGDPSGQIAPRLWGLPVVATPAQTVNNFLTGAFRFGAQIFDRMQMEVLISTEDQDNFVKNMVTIRGEERLALAVYRPAAFVAGTLP